MFKFHDRGGNNLKNDFCKQKKMGKLSKISDQLIECVFVLTSYLQKRNLSIEWKIHTSFWEYDNLRTWAIMTPNKHNKLMQI